MNHTMYRRLISASVDGALADGEERRLREHLAVCAECREHERITKAISAEVRAMAEIDLSPAFPYQVVRSIRLDAQERQSWLPAERLARRLIVVLSAAVVLLVGISIGLQREDSGPAESYFAGEQPDSSVSRTLLTKETISKDDILLAVITRN